MKSISVGTIAFVSNTSWSIYNFRAGLIKKLLAERIPILIIAPPDEYSTKLEDMGCIFEPVKLEQYGTNPLKDLHFCLQLSRIFQKYTIHFLITYTIKPNIFANLVARWHQVPSIAVITGLGHLFTIPSWKTLLVKQLYRFAFQKVAQTWFLNKEDMHFFIRKRIVKTKQAQYLPSEGIDTNYFKKVLHLKTSATSPPFTFLFAGRLMDEKGIREYVQAARLLKAKYPEVRFEILGFIEPHFPYAVTQEELLTWQQEGIIQYLGTTDTIETYLNRVNCVILPTYYREGVPRILLEAASLEIPMIATDNVGCKDIVRHDYNGFLCNKKDVIDLAYWMEKMLQLSEKKRKVMGANGRLVAHCYFREELVIERYLSVLQHYMNLNPSTSYEQHNVAEKLIPWYYQL